ncbi:MAG: glycosyltransferase family 61 protein, partial [Cyclobacteriaceae bacterium]
RIQNRLRLALERSIPYNYHLKPIGLHESKVSNEAVKYQLVIDKYYNALKIPQDLFDILSDYDKPDYSSVTTDYYIAEMDEGRVFSGNVASVAIISRENKLVGDFSFGYKNGNLVDARQNNIFRQKYFTEPTYFDCTVFTMLTGGGGAINYAHFLIDSLSRIYLLKRSGKFDEVEKFLLPSLRYDFQENALKLLGIPKEKVIEGDKYQNIKAKKLIASTAPRGTSDIIPKWVGDFFREEFLKETHLKDFDAPNVYIKRSDSGMRNVLNEDETETMLAKYNFKSFELSKLSFIEKVSLFAKAKLVISVHGAGLANVMFCKPSSHFIEIFPKVFILTTYADLATKVGMGYSYLVCDTSKFADNAHDAQKVHVRIDINKLEEEIKNIIL